MGFIHPQLLWALLVLVPLAVLASFVARRRERRLEAFIHRDTWDTLAASTSANRRFHKGLFLLLALVFSIVAAARPYWGVREREVRGRGIDILFAIDISRSMLAQDVPPSRLESARTTAREVLARLPGQRVGLVPFAGEAFLQCPLTVDYGIMLDMLRRLDTRVIAQQGTNVGAAIRAAIQAFERSGQGQRVIVLISDGEDFGEDALAAAQEAATKEIRIYCVGLGSAEGSLIRLPDGTIQEDQEGNKVVTKLGVETLRGIAQATGGSAFVAQAGRGFDATPLVESLAALKKGDFEAQKRIVREERFHYFLALALLFLVLEALLGERKSARRSQPTFGEAAAA